MFFCGTLKTETQIIILIFISLDKSRCNINNNTFIKNRIIHFESMNIIMIDSIDNNLLRSMANNLQVSGSTASPKLA